MLNTINVAASGLSVAREQVENVMNNVANENTPGYKKRVVGISELAHTDSRITGRGALVGDTSRVTNLYMYDNLTTEKSKQSQYSELSLLLGDVESIFYETDDSGFSSDLDRYFQAVENLRADPSNEIYKNNLRNIGTAVVDDLKTLYKNIEQREISSVNVINDDVAELNTLLNDIGDVNNTITDSEIVSNDLLDKRDELEQKIAAYVDINVDRSRGYELEVTNTTAVIFDDNIHEIKVITNDIAQKDIYANPDTKPVSSDLINLSSWEDSGDKITYRLNNTTSVSVSYGETIKDADGNNVDLNSDGDNTNDIVTKDNVIKALTYKINNTTALSSLIVAYNGDYYTNNKGEKILTSDSTHPEYDAINPYKDRYLVIESITAGDKGKFDGRIIVEDADASKSIVEVEKESTLSIKGTDNLHLEIFDNELPLKSGTLKPLIDNLNTTSNDNLFIKYKEKLDNLAKALSDMSGSYIQNDDDSYVYGVEAVDIHDDRKNRVDIGLFSGSNVSSLTFNDGVVGGLSQDKLDYLATLQWKTNIDIDGTGENLTSFSKYNQTLRVNIAEDKQNIDFKKETQNAVTQSLTNSYEKLTKVDKDEEMMNLIKFQAAYEANAKLISMIDEMLGTILNMRR